MRFWPLRIVLAGIAAFLLGLTAVVWDGLHDEVHPADLGIVLGNTVHPDGTPSPRLAARLDRALELYRQGVFPRILVSGAVGKEGRDEALVMREYLLQRGVPDAQVLTDSLGFTTYATAANARKMMRLRGSKVPWSFPSTFMCRGQDLPCSASVLRRFIRRMHITSNGETSTPLHAS